MTPRSAKRFPTGLALLMLVWACWPPYTTLSPVVALPLLIEGLLLDFAHPPARFHRLGSGAPALLLACGISGAPWLAAVALLVRACAAALLRVRDFRQGLAGAAAPLIALLPATLLPSHVAWLVWPAAFLALSMLLSTQFPSKARLRAALGETAWAVATVSCVSLGAWPELAALVGLLVFHTLQPSEEHDNVIERFQTQALQCTDNTTFAQALLAAARTLEPTAQGTVLEQDQTLAVTPEAAPSGEPVLSFSLGPTLVFTWHRTTVNEDPLLRPLLERARLLHGILEQRKELATPSESVIEAASRLLP